jgi:putative ABC transport system substrate-binding protein
MQRREFIALLGGATAIWPLRALAQKALVRIGFLASGAAGSANSTAQIENLKQGLREHGLVDGRDYVLDVQFAAGDYELFPDMARKLVQAGARMLLVNTIASTRAAQNVNPPVPVVMLTMNDPVGTGLVASLARPGGYTTGMATLHEDLTPKTIDSNLRSFRRLPLSPPCSIRPIPQIHLSSPNSVQLRARRGSRCCHSR